MSSHDEAERVLQQAKAREEAAVRNDHYWRGRMHSYTGGMTPAQLSTDLYGPYDEAMRHLDRTRRDREAAERAAASGSDSALAEAARGGEGTARRHEDSVRRMNSVREAISSPAGQAIVSNPTLSPGEQVERIEQLVQRRHERT